MFHDKELRGSMGYPEERHACCCGESLDTGELAMSVLGVNAGVDFARDVCVGTRRLGMLHLFDAVPGTGDDRDGLDSRGLRASRIQVGDVKKASQTFFEFVE